MSGSGCHGDHLSGTTVSASSEQLRHQEILPGLCVQLGPCLLPSGTLLSSELSSPWGESSRAHQHTPTVDLNVPFHSRWQPFPSGTVSVDYTQGQFPGARDNSG